ncbi:hypothetical protein OZX74_03775 [Bifidobacterium sp. ESL0798]|uniref:hypothetical protein n=1 Tax=Bifidobacterium sp. ESL0798 TaxID=2983235 RepID=UPI0023F62405|nr:hypothetical protein [Bifidobacterium sp. ESL0798]WEV74646.1 hypothetical protein OZX74_03775 [Bifidobacterium sp. ESL0798]
MNSRIPEEERAKLLRERAAAKRLRPAIGGITVEVAANGSFRYIARYHCPACGGRKHSASYRTRQQAVSALNAVATSIDMAKASGHRYQCAKISRPQISAEHAVLSLDDYAKTFIDQPEQCGARSHSPSHRKNMRQTYNQLIKPTLGRTPLPQLTTSQVTSWHNSLKVSEHRKAVAYNLLHSIMQTAYHDPSESKVTTNPVDIPRAGVRKRSTERYAATPEEIERFVSKAIIHTFPKPGDKPGQQRGANVSATASIRMLFLTTTYCGLRREEAICLTRGDVKKSETGIWYLDIDKAATRGIDPATGTTRIIVGNPKSPASKRHVPISPLLIDRLLEYMKNM